MKWIEYYIEAVISQLPKKDQIEVKNELLSNILDMLPPEPTEEEVKALLLELGSPAELAQKYRQKPNYLIGPQVYPDYISALKIILPIAAIAGTIFGGITAFVSGDVTELSLRTLPELLAKMISVGLPFTLIALFWTSLGFVVAERTGTFKKGQHWQTADLMKLEQKQTISFGDSLAELIIVLFMIGCVLWSLLNHFHWLDLILADRRIPIFTGSFLQLAAVLIVLLCIGEIVVIALKMTYRRWRLPVCLASITVSLVSLVCWIIALSQKEMFTAEFLDYLSTAEWTSHSQLSWLRGFSANDGLPENAFQILVALAVLGTVISILHTIYQGWKERRSSLTA